MITDKLEKIINSSFEQKEKINPKSDKKVIKAINETIDLVDFGKIRVANKIDGSWVVNQWIKKAILLSFRVNKMTMSKGQCQKDHTQHGMTKFLVRLLNGKKKIGKKLDIGMYQTGL